MKKKLQKQIEIPKGTLAKYEEGIFIVSGPQGNVSKKINFGKLNVEIDSEKITLGNEKSTKVEKKIMNTNTAHIKNMISGVNEKFEYELKVCSGHFPMTVKKEGNQVIIKNFLGEKIERKATVPKDVELEINKNMISIKSSNKELAGQAAANLERATSIKGRDKRIFQDGIYIIKKAGKEI